MARSYQLVNSNISRKKGLSKIQIIKINLFKYMHIDYGKVYSKLGKEQPFITIKGELKKNAAREEQEKLIAQGLRRTEKDWTKKES